MKTQRYLNKRAEMWGAMKEWLEAGGSLPDVPELKSELVTPEYSFDAANRLRLESKEHIKERLGEVSRSRGCAGFDVCAARRAEGGAGAECDVRDGLRAV